MSSADEFEFRQAVEEDGADLTSDEALVLFAALDTARAQLTKLESAVADARFQRDSFRQQLNNVMPAVELTTALRSFMLGEDRLMRAAARRDWLNPTLGLPGQKASVEIHPDRVVFRRQ